MFKERVFLFFLIIIIVVLVLVLEKYPVFLFESLVFSFPLNKLVLFFDVSFDSFHLFYQISGVKNVCFDWLFEKKSIQTQFVHHSLVEYRYFSHKHIHRCWFKFLLNVTHLLYSSWLSRVHTSYFGEIYLFRIY